MSKKDPQWKEFERTVTEIQRQLAPGAEVRHNVRLLGKSGSRRQFDVLATQKVGVAEVKVVFECKRHGRKITIEKVDAFAKRMEDVNASAGVMVATSEFDAGARGSAERHGILLLTAREAAEADWNGMLGPDAWQSLIVFHKQIPSCCVHFEPDVSLSGLTADSPVYAEDGRKPLGAFGEVFLDPVRKMPLAIGATSLELTPEIPMHIECDGRMRTLRSVDLEVVISAMAYPLNPSFASGHVLADVTGEIKAVQAYSEGFDWQELISRMEGVPMSQEDVEKLDPSKTVLAGNAETLPRYLRFSLAAAAAPADRPAGANSQ